MTRILLTILFLFSIASSTFGQSQRLKGTIIADSLKGFEINIVNYTKKIGITNDAQGYFEIPVQVHDSIIFSSVQYEIVSITVLESDIKNESFLLKLTPVIQELDQVHISNSSLSGNIDKDAKDIKIQPFVNNKSLGLPFRDIKQPTQIERRIYTARTSRGLIPVELIINTISGKLKKLKRIKSIEELKRIVEVGEITFDTSFFIEELGLPENRITDFIYYCTEDDYFEDLLPNTKKLTLLSFFQKKAKEYKKRKGIY